ncbi:MAG: hypothetical protein KDA48_09720 [Amphiplicatus sp.]|nr:hypothetical protein [Amphiplicatus sp.]
MAGAEALGGLEMTQTDDVRRAFQPLLLSLDSMNESNNREEVSLIKSITNDLISLFCVNISENQKIKLSKGEVNILMESYARSLRELDNLDLKSDYISRYPINAIFDLLNAISLSR